MNTSSPEYLEISNHFGGDIKPGLGRSAMDQALYQMAGIGVSLALALVGGLVTGNGAHIPIYNIGLIYQHLKLHAVLITMILLRTQTTKP